MFNSSAYLLGGQMEQIFKPPLSLKQLGNNNFNMLGMF